ncbi:MAG: OmpH family outer membrane protein [Pseudomonadota bacterium]
MKKYALIVTSLLFLSYSLMATENLKIGYVDLQLALTSVEEGKKAQQNLESSKKNKEKLIKQKQDDLKKLHDELQTQSLILSEDARKAKEEDYKLKVLEFQKLIQEANKELDSSQMQYINTIISELTQIVAEIAKKEQYTIILEKSQSILFALPSMDLTQTVIDEFNKRMKAKKNKNK